jgi:hypothetical protein
MSVANPVSVEILLGRASQALEGGRAEQYCMPLLPLLEHPWSKGAEEVSLAAKRFDALKEKAESIPEEVVLFALSEHSQYWVGLALRWIEDGFPVSPRIKEMLFSVSQRKNLPQEERHTAWRLFHKNA